MARAATRGGGGLISGVLTHSPTDNRDYFEPHALSLSARAVARDRRPTELKTVYTDKAIDLIRRAIADGWENAAPHSRTDPDLDPIR